MSNKIKSLVLAVILAMSLFGIQAFAESTIGITNFNKPDNLVYGKPFSIYGNISSNYNITLVVVEVLSSSGTKVIHQQANPNSKTYSLAKIDSVVRFDKLPAGSYIYGVSAADSSGSSKLLIYEKFTVQTEPSSLGISGYNSPSTLQYGKPFSLYGNISSNYNISLVVVEVLSSSGTKVIHKQANPNSTTYSLAKIDSEVRFETLPTGSYIYGVSAADSSGFGKLLIYEKFTVQSSNTNTPIFIPTNTPTKMPTNTPTNNPTKIPTYTPIPTPTNTPIVNSSTPTPTSCQIQYGNDSSPSNQYNVNIAVSTPTKIYAVTPSPSAAYENEQSPSISPRNSYVPTSVVLSNNMIEMNVNENAVLKAAVIPSSVTSSVRVRWRSDKEYIASVDNYGNITAKQPGEAIITVETLEGNCKDFCRVIVKTSDTSIKAPSDPGFLDIDKAHWAYNAIATLTQEKIINGYPDGRFYPNRLVSRAEFAKMMLISAGKEPVRVKNSSFKDVKITDWFSPFVEGAKDYLTGFKEKDGLIFKPGILARREDMSYAVVKIKGFEDSVYNLSNIEDIFSDYSAISQGLRMYIAISVEKGLIRGYPNGTFKPQESITRSEAAALLYNAFKDSGFGNKLPIKEDENNE